MSKAPDKFDFWYAVNNTEILLRPSRRLETFGNTIINYHLLSELMDTVNQVRVREGRIKSFSPRILTPEMVTQSFLEGFADPEAGRYVDWLREHAKDLRVLQYGFTIRKEHFSEHVVTDNIRTVAERVQAQVKEHDDSLGAVVIGVESPWEVCLVKLMEDVIRHSVVSNVRELERRRLFDDVDGVPRMVRDEIDAEFRDASRDASLVKPLAARLQKLGLFKEYEDRFFALVRQTKRAP